MCGIFPLGDAVGVLQPARVCAAKGRFSAERAELVGIPAQGRDDAGEATVTLPHRCARYLYLQSLLLISFFVRCPPFTAGESESGARPERAQRCEADALFLDATESIREGESGRMKPSQKTGLTG